MREEKEIRELIEKIGRGDTVNTTDERYTGFTKITDKGDNWIEALEWVLKEE